MKRSRTSASIPCLAALVLAGCGHALTPLPRDGGPPWRRLETPHFIVYTDLGGASAQLLVDELELFRHVMIEAALAGGGATRGVAVVLRDQKDVDVLSGDAGSAFWFTANETPLARPLVVFADDPLDDAAIVLKHMLVHLVRASVIPEAPRWLSEGLAAYFETAIYAPSSGAARVGALPFRRVNALREHDLLPLPQVLAGRFLDDDVERERFHATSWLLVAYLLNERPRDFSAYLQALAEGATDPWARAFAGVQPAAVEQAMRAWLRSGRHLERVVTVGGAVPAATERLATDADALAIRALVYAAREHPAGAPPGHRAAGAGAHRRASGRLDGLVCPRDRPRRRSGPCRGARHHLPAGGERRVAALARLPGA